MGLHASDTSQLVLEECRVPESDRIGADGEAFDDVKKVLDRGRIGIGALALGLGRAALETAIAYAKERKQFGRPIAEFEMIQWKMVRARTQLDAGRLLVHRAAALADCGKPFGVAASKAKLYATEAASRAANDSPADPRRLRLPARLSGRAHRSATRASWRSARGPARCSASSSRRTWRDRARDRRPPPICWSARGPATNAPPRACSRSSRTTTPAPRTRSARCIRSPATRRSSASPVRPAVARARW